MGLLDRFTSDGIDGPKVAFIGIDGVPSTLLEDLIEEGRLPNIERIASDGTLTDMNAVIPAESSACWPSMTTGCNPGKTGVLGFQEREHGSYSTYIPLSNHVLEDRVWDVVEQNNGRSVVLNVPVTFPPSDLEGLMVSGFLTPSLDDASSDEEVVDYLESIDYKIDVDASLGHEDKEAFMEDAYDTLEKTKKALFHFMEKEEWNLLWHVFMTTDRVNHFLWEDYENGTELGDKFLEFYEKVDGIIGEIYDELDDDVTTLIAADHGFCTLKRELDINQWLRDSGYQSIDGDDSLEGLSNESKAYSMIPGRIYLNKEGREPEGGVSEEEYDELRDEIKQELLNLTDPDGEEVIDDVVYKEDIYNGDFYDRTPDLIALPNWGFDLKASFEDTELFTKGARNGMHTLQNATLIIDRDSVNNPDSIMDITPTVLDLLEIEIPDEIDGESIIN